MSEILEHIPSDESAISEMVRVLKPGGVAAVTVPRYWPEKVCWALSDEYHEVEGGHVRIYKASELAGKLRTAGLEVTGTDHAHALHAPYWWLKCAVGVENNDNPLVKGYHQLLVWDMMSKPWLTRVGEQVLNRSSGSPWPCISVSPRLLRLHDGRSGCPWSGHRRADARHRRSDRRHAGGIRRTAVVPPRRANRSVGPHRIGDGVVGHRFSRRGRGRLRVVAAQAASRWFLADPHCVRQGRGCRHRQQLLRLHRGRGVASLPDHRG